MAYNEKLVERIRSLLAVQDGITERKMFGGLCIMLNGNMVGGVSNEYLLLRVGPDTYEATLCLPGASEMTFTGKPMRGFVEVSPDAMKRKDQLARWIEKGVLYAASLPPKQKSSSHKKFNNKQSRP